MNMNTEDILREVLSKMCSLHGKHANIEIKDNWKLHISACCHEFQQQMENILKDFQPRTESISVA